MQEEYLDIVDENGNPTGKKEVRSVVHEKGLWHKTVHIYFYRIKNNTIELLVHLRSRFKSEKPNLWATHFGGHVEAGFSLEKAIIQETSEETGAKLNPSDIFRGIQGKFDGITNREFYYVFYYNFKGNIKDLRFSDEEVQKANWMTEIQIARSIKDNPEKWTVRSKDLDIILDNLKSKL